MEVFEMRVRARNSIAILAILLCAVAASQLSGAVTYTTSDGARIKGLKYPTEGERAVLFAHGAVFDKESWAHTAEACRQNGVSAVTIDFRGYGESTTGADPRAYFRDILGGVEYLVKDGYEEIVLVGGSMGAMAIIRALEEPVPDAVTKALLLAPGNGAAIESKTIEKLFVVTEGDRANSATKTSHHASAEPKRLEILPGDAHAQHIFKTDQADALTKIIVDFVTK